MVVFYKYEVRVTPGTPPALALYAAEREELDQNAEYRRLIDENRPCRFQLTETQFWYHNGEDDRSATEEEIRAWTKDDSYIFMPQMEVLSPSYYYPSFGDEAILAPLREKLQSDYAQYLAEWKTAYGESRDTLFSRIGEVCTVKTVYDNLFNYCGYYPQAYMKDLAEEENPLRIVAYFYEKSGRFAIEPEAMDVLDIMERTRSNLGQYHAIEERAANTDNHEQLMVILNENLDRENLVNEQRWQQLDFDGVLNKSVEIHTMRQLYHTLRNEKELYPAEQLDIAARLAEPLGYDENRLVGERQLCDCTLDEINGILPQMYPDTIPEPNPWESASAYEPKRTENIQSVPFTVAEGKEQEYLGLKTLNSPDFYGGGVIRYLETWASMMEKEISDGASVAEAAQRTRYEADKEGITGHMYGYAVATLSKFWTHGEELRNWHNQQYGYFGEEIINPAILGLSDDEEPEETDGIEQSGMTM